MDDRVQRSYYLPDKLVDAFDREAAKHGYVRGVVVAVVMVRFLESSPDDRARMFENLDRFLNGKTK
jgi:hypothetical protein